MNSRNFARRKMLKGLGVSLALPWLETFAPSGAKAQAAAGIKRYMSVYFPNGTTDDWWKPTGSGAAWQMSPILEPLTPLKDYVTVLSNVGNYSPFGGHIEPSHGHNSASAWTGVKAEGENNGISVDQLIADQMVAANGGVLPTPLHSLQLGASTIDGSPDGIPAQNSHSISWKSPSEPLFKIVSPQGAFDRIVGGGLPLPSAGGNTTPAVDPIAERRRALKQSALDFVEQDALSLQAKLSVSDRAKVEQFLESVRALELRVASPTMPGSSLMCSAVPRPDAIYGVGMEPAGYNRGAHLDLMTDLLVMAVQCDITRVYSYMLDDARSEYVYKDLMQREFTATGSTVTTMAAGNYHGAQHGSAQEFASITHFIVEKMAALATKLAAIQEGDSNVLANFAITFASGMHGSNHDGLDLPICLIGGGGGVLKQNQYLDLGDANLADVHLTVMKSVFGCPQTTFGSPQGGYTSGTIPALLV